MAISSGWTSVCCAAVFWLTPCATASGEGHYGSHPVDSTVPAGYYSRGLQDQATNPQADLFGCGPSDEKHELINPKGQRPTPAPPSGKALIYIVRRKGARFRMFPQNKLGANGRWVAVLKRGDYAFFTVDPGALKLCYSGDRGRKEGGGFLYLTVEAGKTYYLRGDTGATGQRTELTQVTEEEGRALVAESEYVSFRVKR